MFELFWKDLELKFQEYKLTLEMNDDEFDCCIANHVNEVRFVGAYMSFTRDFRDTDEAVLSVSAYQKENGIFLSSDICLDDGEFVSIGPERTITSAEMKNEAVIKGVFSEWFSEFDIYLAKNIAPFRKAIHDIPRAPE